MTASALTAGRLTKREIAICTLVPGFVCVGAVVGAPEKR
jgi:hypothetical protein